MGDMIVCDYVSMSVVSTSRPLSYDERQSSLVDETPEEGIYDNQVPFGESVFRHIRKFRESLSLYLLFFCASGSK